MGDSQGISGLLFRICPTTGRIRGVRRGPALLLPLLGLLSLIWFLVRVVPKPSRALYPCMRVAAPFATSFVAWVLGMASTVFALRKAREGLRSSRYGLAAASALAGVVALLVTSMVTSEKGYAYVASPGGLMKLAGVADITAVAIDSTHGVMGTAVGIYPGRVVWVHNPRATNEQCTNTDGDYWYSDGNTYQWEVDAMFSEGVQRLTGTESDDAAWNSLFTSFNRRKDRGDRGYQTGEKIAIKVNLCSGYKILQDQSRRDVYDKTGEYGMVDTSPQMMLALLRHLVNVVGVDQDDISIGDPMRPFFNEFFTKLEPEFPEVHYVDVWGRL